MKKSILIAAAVLAASLALAACGGTSTPATTAAAEGASKADDKAEGSQESTGGPTEAEAPKELKKIVVGASPAPHAEILKAASDVLAQKGYELDIKEYVDYIQPNLALESGDLDAN